MDRIIIFFGSYTMGYAVAQLVEALRYKPEGRGFDFLWVVGIFHWLNLFSRTMALGSTNSVTEPSIRDISRGKGGRCVGLTALLPSCADFLDILGSSTSWSPQVCNGVALKQTRDYVVYKTHHLLFINRFKVFFTHRPWFFTRHGGADEWVCSSVASWWAP